MMRRIKGQPVSGHPALQTKRRVFGSMDKEKLIKEFEEICNYTMRPHEFRVLNDVLVLLK